MVELRKINSITSLTTLFLLIALTNGYAIQEMRSSFHAPVYSHPSGASSVIFHNTIPDQRTFQPSVAPHPFVHPQMTIHSNVPIAAHPFVNPSTVTSFPQRGIITHQNIKNREHRRRRFFVVTPLFFAYPFGYNYNMYDNSYVNPNDNANIYSTDQSSYPSSTDNTYPQAITSDTNDNEVQNENVIPDGDWIWGQNGIVPDNAIVYGYLPENNEAVYYCQVQFDNLNHFGVLVKNEGCYVNDNGNILRVSKYQALIPRTQ
jgi:hypothetical protein